MSSTHAKKINLFDLLKDSRFIQRYCDNLNLIIAHYPREEFVEIVKLSEISKLNDIKIKLSNLIINSCNLGSKLIIIFRKGCNDRINTANDIYTLSHFVLDNQVSEEIDNLFNLTIKPFEFISEKKKIDLLVGSVYNHLNKKADMSSPSTENNSTV